MEIRINEDYYVVKNNGKEFKFPKGTLMLSHCDLNYLKPGDHRMILQRYKPRDLRKRNTLLQTSYFETLRNDFRCAADKTRNIVRRKTENSLIFPCHKFSQILYTAVTEDFLRRCILLQEEINRKIAVIPLFRSQISVRRFRSVEQMFNRILGSNQKLRGTFLPSSFLKNNDCLTVLRQSELDFLFLSAWGVNYTNLENFYVRLDRLIELEKPVFVIDAAIFTGDVIFAPRLANTGICGYSLPFVDYYIPEEPTYYDVSNAVPGRYKNYRTMVNQYGSDDFPLSEICNCSVCRKNTIRTFFFERDLVPWEKNRLHKLEFVDISSSEEESRSPAEAAIP